MKRQVVYLMSGQAHLPYLVVSLYTLRKHWPGSVRVFAWPESFDIVKTIAEDTRLAIEVEVHEPKYRARRDEGRRGNNDQFISKIRLFQTLHDIDIGLYLDADSSIHGNLMPLFRAAKQYGFCATRFSSWTTAGSVPRKRIKRLREFEEIDKGCISTVLRIPWPSVNGGVWAARPDSPVLSTWEQWTWAARHIFIADETVLHALLPKYVPEKLMFVWPDGRFNCSCNPKWMPEKLGEGDIVVWHYHGDSNVRPDKHGGHAYRRWLPMWMECVEKNIGNVLSWLPNEQNDWLGNKWLALLSE